jgi:hypothetical protein
MMHMTGFLAGDYADSKGWDCFKDGYTKFSDDVKNFKVIWHGHTDEVTAERDEARREVCRNNHQQGGVMPHHYAKSRGWDCFNDKTEADTNNTLFRTTDGE